MEKKQATFSVKDWIAISLSAAAFALSATATYFSLFRQDDNLSVVFRDTPLLYREDDTTITTEYFREPSVVLINNGNRSAVINSIKLVVYEYKSEEANSCDYGASAANIEYSMEFEPTVVKEKEVVYKKMSIGQVTLSPGGVKVQEGARRSYKTSLTKENQGKKSVPVEVCLLVDLSTPRYAVYHTRISLNRLDVDREWTDMGSYYPEPPRPYQLLRNIDTIFGF